MRYVRVTAVLIALVLLSVLALPAAADAPRNSGFYDHQVIEYVNAQEDAGSIAAALQLSKGLVVYHIVDSNGVTPAVQCARLFATFPNDASSCNVLNFIPSEVGYTGGSWDVQIFHWKPGATVRELSKDDDILAAVAGGEGTLEVTSMLVRCPVVDFANLR